MSCYLRFEFLSRLNLKIFKNPPTSEASLPSIRLVKVTAPTAPHSLRKRWDFEEQSVVVLRTTATPSANGGREVA